MRLDDFLKGGDDMEKKEVTYDVILSDLLNKLKTPEQATDAIYRIAFNMISRMVDEAITEHIKEDH